ncbi:hypothetical protein BJ138DRAFT_1151698 [Hygrophoropsis aurantiaca]|uniref:Uncharacterized protein n=1 Tax=Hygrophoropsis aurantiaca TaxID=72124 RepID=A0ACB8ABW0_9AGAM|nr:hypothetical protein BJ138DRAFT_1151698 [Hygrophoropsis aurantiaca]
MPLYRYQPLPVSHLHRKDHYCIVFSGLGTAIHDMKNLDGVFRCIKDGLAGLKHMHQLNLVHRDCSTANVLNAAGRGRLVDLDYASDSSSTRTGTLSFMAVEVDQARYKFFPIYALSDHVRNRTAGGVLDASPFVPNWLHDVESVLWMCIWVLFRRASSGQCCCISGVRDQCPASSAPIQAQRAAYRRLFPGLIHSPGRLGVLQNTHTFGVLVWRALDPGCRGFGPAGRALFPVLYNLVDVYCNAEVDRYDVRARVDHDDFGRVYRAFGAELGQLERVVGPQLKRVVEDSRRVRFGLELDTSGRESLVTL